MRTNVAELNAVETKSAETNAEKEMRTKTNLAETSGSSPPSLSDLESKIGTGIRRIKSAWVEVGLALGEIRDRRLYLPLSFDDYLANHPDWEITRRHADRIIKSARIADAVNQSKMSDWFPDVPNEAVGRALANVPEEKQAEVYAAACVNCDSGEPTAFDIEKAIAKLFGNNDPESNGDGNETATDDGSEAETEADGDVESECEGEHADDGEVDDDEPESNSGDDSVDDDDEADQDYVHDYIVTIGCKLPDSQAVLAAIADYRPKINPLNTKFSFPTMWADDLARLFVSLANVVDKLHTNIDLRVKAGAE